VTDPLFWLVLSLLFVTISLTIALAVAIPALKELARAARSAEKLFDTLRREFPPTLQAIRLTGLEISDLTDEVTEGVQSAGQIVKQVDQSLSDVRKQTQRVQSGTQKIMVGLKVAWRTFTRSPKPTNSRRSLDRLPPPRPEAELNFGDMPPAETRPPQRRQTTGEKPYGSESSTPAPRQHGAAETPNGSATSTYAQSNSPASLSDRQTLNDNSQADREQEEIAQNERA